MNRAWVMLAMAGLSACATVPKSAPTPTPMTAQAAGLGGEAVQPASDAWWQSFGDAQLNQLIDAALKGNPTLAQTGARLHAAQAQVETAHAGQLPTAGLSGAEQRTKMPAVFPAALAGGQSVWIGDLGATLSWDVDLWGRQADLVAQSRALAGAAQLDGDNARLLIAGAVAQSYLALYRAYEYADIAQRTQAQREDILAITRKRVTAGLDTRVELRQAEGAVPEARLTLLQAQAAQALATHELAALTGQGADAYAQISRPQLNIDTALTLPSQLPINLLGRRPDVLAARARLEAAGDAQRAAKAAFYPSVNLRALAGYASFSMSNLISAEAFGYGAGGAFSLPLFDGGRLRAQYHGTEAAIESAVATYNDTVLTAVHQAADQLTQVDSLAHQLEQQRQTLDAAEDAYRLAEERYRAGLSGYLSVLSAETQVLTARRERVELVTAQAQARISLLLAVGGSFQAPQAPAVAAR